MVEASWSKACSSCENLLFCYLSSQLYSCCLIWRLFDTVGVHVQVTTWGIFGHRLLAEFDDFL